MNGTAFFYIAIPGFATMAEFIVESSGLCFLCLNTISNDISYLDSALEPAKFAIQLHSIQYLARHLKLDMKKVFYEEGPIPIPTNLLAKVRKSKLKVALCDDCADLNCRFSVVYRHLEKIQMEVKASLDLIHQKMLGTEEEAGDTIVQKSLIECDSPEQEELVAKLKIADIIRSETMQTCSQKLSRVLPRVKVRKLTPNEEATLEEKKKSRFRARTKIKYGSYCDFAPNSDSQTDNIVKIETEVSGGNVEDFEDDYGEFDPEPAAEQKFTNAECHHCHIKVEDLSAHHCSLSTQPRTNFQTRIGANARRSKSQAASFKCNKCRKGFGRLANLRRHQLAVHLGRRFRCGQCTKSFCDITYLKGHQKTFHQGQGFQCDTCNAAFSSQGNLDRHRTRVHRR